MRAAVLAAGLAGGIAAALAAGEAAAQAPVACGEPYVVRRGDTLQRIAIRAYGPDASFRMLLAPNASLFSRVDPSLIEPGMVIEVPCLAPPAAQATDIPAAQAADTPAAQAADTPAAQAADTPAAQAADAPSAASSAGQRPDAEAAPTSANAGPAAVAVPADSVPPPRPAPARGRVVAAAAPLGPPEVALLRATAAAAAANLPLDRIEDRAAHLDPLLSEGLFAVSLPWLRPDCAAPGLAPPSRALCDDALWSAPLAELAVVTLRPLAPAAGPACAQAALAPVTPDAARHEASPDACVAALMAGEAGTAILEAGAADAAIRALGAADAVREDLGALRVVTLHAVALRGSPLGAEALAALDAALAAPP